MSNTAPWWQTAIFYQIYPRSFYDTNSDGIGDLQGIIQKLDYLKDIGIGAIWISPIYQSPMFDFGYDISDYKVIDQVFGNITDFKQLLHQAHQRGIKIVMDLIMNHTSHKHKWFLESASSKTNPKRDWYIWKPSNFVQPPNNWRSVFGGSGWEYHPKTKQYYYHSFLKEQPDLNWRNPDLQETFFNEIKYWLELGVDGFRLDVLNFIVKDKHLRNNPQPLALPFLQKHEFTRNRPKSYKIIAQLRQLIDSYANRMLVAEIYLPHPGNSAMVGSYLGDGTNGVNLAFDFSLIFTSWGAQTYNHCIQNSLQHIPQNGWPTLVLSNHDLLRSINRLWFRGHQIEKAKIEAVLLLTLKGTPFLYYGEEIGMKNRRIPRIHIKDPLGKKLWPLFTGRDMARTPMQWNSTTHGGFSTAKPWLPIKHDFKKVNVDAQQFDPNSMLAHYKRLIQLRTENPSLQSGQWQSISTTQNVLIYKRITATQEATILINFDNTRKEILLPTHLLKRTAIFSTHTFRLKQKMWQTLAVEPFEATIFILPISVPVPVG